MTRVWLLVLGVFAVVIFATTLLVVIPNTMIAAVRPAPQLSPYTAKQARGREVYIEQGCVYCHSQQVRGPDLINIGARQPSELWHHVHLYQPRAYMPWSIMPAFPYLYEVKDAASVPAGTTAYEVPGGRLPKGKVIVPTADAEALVAYLVSLKRTYPVPTDSVAGDRSVGGRSEHTMP